MVFIKRVNNNDQGDSTHWGGDHNDILDKYFDDVDIEGTTGKPAKINTKTEFRDNKLYLWNGTNTFKYNIRPGTLTQDVELSLPTISANGTLLSTGGANDWTALQTFRNTLLALRNPANTASYIHNTSAIVANRNVTWPLLTADDTIAFNNFGAELQNKTVNIDQNTLKHSTTNAEGDVLIYDTASGRYIRLAGGTDGQVLGRVSGDTAWIAAGGSGGLATPEIGNTITGVFYGTGAAAGAGVWSGFLTNAGSIAGVPISSVITLEMGMLYSLDATGENGGFRTNDEHFTRFNDPELWVRYQVTSATPSDTDYRVAIGFTSDVTADHGIDNALNDKSGFMWYKDATDTNIQVGRNDHDATMDKDATVSLAATNVSINTIRLFAENANSRWGISLNGAAATYFTTEIPSGTRKLGSFVFFENADAIARDFYIYGAYFKAKVI